MFVFVLWCWISFVSIHIPGLHRVVFLSHRRFPYIHSIHGGFWSAFVESCGMTAERARAPVDRSIGGGRFEVQFNAWHVHAGALTASGYGVLPLRFRFRHASSTSQPVSFFFILVQSIFSSLFSLFLSLSLSLPSSLQSRPSHQPVRLAQNPRIRVHTLVRRGPLSAPLPRSFLLRNTDTDTDRQTATVASQPQASSGDKQERRPRDRSEKWRGTRCCRPCWLRPRM